MTAQRYGSLDFYHTLAAIEDKVIHLACRGKEVDGEASWKDLLDYIRKEREASAIRAAKAKAEYLRRMNNLARENKDGV